MYSVIRMRIINRFRVFFFLFFGTLPEINILKKVKIYIIPTEISKISTSEPDFHFIPKKDMYVKSGDVLFNPEKKMTKNVTPDS